MWSFTTPATWSLVWPKHSRLNNSRSCMTSMCLAPRLALFGLPFSGCEGRGLRIECEGVEHVAWVQNHDALPGHLNCTHEGRVQIDESTADLIGHIADGVR